VVTVLRKCSSDLGKDADLLPTLFIISLETPFPSPYQIIEGNELLRRDDPAPVQHNPQKYCNILLSPDQTTISPSDGTSPLQSRPSHHDIILTFHARLIHLRREWHVETIIPHHPSDHPSSNAATNSINLSTPNSTTSSSSNPSLHSRRLATRTNDYLAIWKSDLDTYNLEDRHDQLGHLKRQIELDWLHARMCVNYVAAKMVWNAGATGTGGGTLGEGRSNGAGASGTGSLGAQALWKSFMGVGLDAGFELLQRCASWTPKEGLVELPFVYYKVSHYIARGTTLIRSTYRQFS
jgi:hypothetical protein